MNDNVRDFKDSDCLKRCEDREVVELNFCARTPTRVL